MDPDELDRTREELWRSDERCVERCPERCEERWEEREEPDARLAREELPDPAACAESEPPLERLERDCVEDLLERVESEGVRSDTVMREELRYCVALLDDASAPRASPREDAFERVEP